MATAVYAYAFYGCTKLRDFQAQYVQQIRDYAFHSCTGLVSLSALNVISLSQYGFYGCTGLVDIYFSKLNAVPASAFYGCRSLELADMGAVTSIAASAFYNCYKLKALVLRGTTVATLTYVSALSNCYWLKGTTNTTYNPSGEQGYVYVPAALLEKYAAATNWVSAGVQFRALEYYTVDRTITGALDESKI